MRLLDKVQTYSVLMVALFLIASTMAILCSHKDRQYEKLQISEFEECQEILKENMMKEIDEIPKDANNSFDIGEHNGLF
jgi:hypothetical protein